MMKTKKPQAPSKSKSDSSPKKSRSISLKKIVPAKLVSKKSTVTTKSTSVPAGREQRLAAEALDLVDKAAFVLRNGIRDGAATTAQSRIAAKKKAHELLGKASNNLSMALNNGTVILQDLIRKI
jgi:hypothetical protein